MLHEEHLIQWRIPSTIGCVSKWWNHKRQLDAPSQVDLLRSGSLHDAVKPGAHLLGGLGDNRSFPVNNLVVLVVYYCFYYRLPTERPSL